ncbi:MAG TPA: hypothetical protein VNT32_06895, partial [Thermoleophilaceae bacterium]|nr:hypothetical protein [Thermoleophilaceae bacterium]
MPGITTEVEVARRPLSDYADAAGAGAVERIRALAEPLTGARVLHVAPSAGGSHAAGHLGALLPLLRDAGVEVHWRVVSGGGPAARVARALEDGLRGAETAISGEDWSAYRDAWSGAGEGGFDLVVAHDAGALGLGASPPQSGALV